MERLLLERYGPVLHGTVLELVPGGSRLTQELVEQARAYTGMGPSSAVIGVCRTMYRSGTFVHSAITELQQFQPSSFSAIVGGRCAIDLLDEQRRRLLFERLHRVLSPTGLLIFSSQNEPEAGDPAAPEVSTGRGGGLLRGFRLRSSRAPMDERELGSELLSGIDGERSSAQYRISRDAQERQLEELGFRLAECLDLDGRPVEPGDRAEGSPELHYVVRPDGPRRAG